MPARRSPIVLAVVLALCVACAGDLVVRAPDQLAAPRESALSALPPVSVLVPPATGGRGSREPIGTREPGLGSSGGPVYLTEDPADVVRRLVVQELAAAGHRVVESGGDAVLEITLLGFSVGSERRGRGWDVAADVRFSIRVSKSAGSDDWRESIYTSEREQRTYVWPGVGITEQVLAECLDELGRLVASRAALASALEHYARTGGVAGPHRLGRAGP